LRNKKIRADLNLWAINLKFLGIVDNYVTYHVDTSQIELSTNFFIPQKFFRILYLLGLNFNANNLKFSQIVGDIVVYNL